MRLNNSEIIQEIVNRGKIQSAEITGFEVGKTAVPTIETNPQIVKNSQFVGSGTLTNATSQVMATGASANQDFYLTSIQFGYIKDATSTSTLLSVTGTINGLTVYFIRIPCITLTAQAGQVAISFPHPIKLDRGTSLAIGSSTNVANVLASCCFTGFADETSKG